jgi:hypothetical protein
MNKLNLMLAALVATVALAGCAGDDDGDGTTTTTTTDGMNGDGNGTAPLQPIYINGTAQGLLDCTLYGLVGLALSPESASVPAEAQGRDYVLTFDGGMLDPAGAATACVVFDSGSVAGNSGTIPDDATQVTVYIDFGADVSYSIEIE